MKARIQDGFTLIEVMIVVVIVAILAAIAIPSYSAYVIETRRSDAKAALLEVSQRLERCYSQFNSFNHADCSVSLPQASPEGYYAVTGKLTAGTYALTAKPASGSPQADDADCTSLTINHLNQRGATGANTADCW